MFSHDYKLEEIRFIELIIKFLYGIFGKLLFVCYLCVLASDSIRLLKTFCSSFLNGFQLKISFHPAFAVLQYTHFCIIIYNRQT